MWRRRAASTRERRTRAVAVQRAIRPGIVGATSSSSGAGSRGSGSSATVSLRAGTRRAAHRPRRPSRARPVRGRRNRRRRSSRATNGIVTALRTPATRLSVASGALVTTINRVPTSGPRTRASAAEKTASDATFSQCPRTRRRLRRSASIAEQTLELDREHGQRPANGQPDGNRDEHDGGHEQRNRYDRDHDRAEQRLRPIKARR